MRGLLSGIQAVRPRSRAELLDILAAEPDRVPIAGGTDVMVRLEAGGHRGERFVDLGGLAGELRGVHVEKDAVEIGALTTFWDVRRQAALTAEFPLLEEAARTVGALQIQSRGTWAGNIANGSPAADGVAALLAYDAELALESKGGRRLSPLHGFFSGYKKMDLRPGEFIAAIRLPRKGPDRWHAFHKIGTRRAQAITKVGLTLSCRADGTHRVIGVSVAPWVARYPSIEAFLDAAGPRRHADLAQLVARDVKPISDIRSTAAYRRRVFLSLLVSEVEYHGLKLG